MAGGFKGPRVITVMDMIHERFPDAFVPSDPTSKRKRFAVSHVDGIICPSVHTSRDLQSLLKVPEQKIRVIPLGLAAFPAAMDTPPKQIDRPYLLYVGDRRAYKDFNLLLDAYLESATLHQTFALVCFGGGAPTRTEYERTKRRHVAFLSGSDTLLSTLYRNATALIVTSRYEGFGFPPLEAMQFGCPVLASDGGSLPEIMGEAGLFFHATERDDLSAKLTNLIDDRDLRYRLIAAGKTRAAEFTWDRTALATRTLYQELVS
jgi:glycosyltransferase involved in cell wall biosynthesis